VPNPNAEEEKFSDELRLLDPGMDFSGGYRNTMFQFPLSDVFEYVSKTDTWRSLNIPDKKMFLPRYGNSTSLILI